MLCVAFFVKKIKEFLFKKWLKRLFWTGVFIVISQEIQNKRAVYIARRFRIEAYKYNAKSVQKWGGFKTKAREYLARVKAWWEVLWGIEPTFLGKKWLSINKAIHTSFHILQKKLDCLNSNH